MKRPRSTESEALTVHCSHCARAPHKSCMTPSGVARAPHVVRREYAHRCAHPVNPITIHSLSDALRRHYRPIAADVVRSSLIGGFR